MSQPEPAASPPPPSGNLLGCALFVLGALIALPSGLCTAIGGVGLVVGMIEDPKQLATDFGDVLPFAVITLLSLAVGVGLIWAGWRAGRR